MKEVSPEVIELVSYVLSVLSGWILKWLQGRKAENIGNAIIKIEKQKKNDSSKS